MNAKIFSLLILFSSKLYAGTVADLELEIEFNDINGVVYEQQGEFVARITNLGPDVAAPNTTQFPIGILSSIIQDNGSFTPEIQFEPAIQNNNDECFFVLVIGDPPPGGGVVYAYDLNIPSLEVNETVVCYGEFIRNFQSGSRVIEWEIDNPFDIDPNEDNNVQSIIFGIQPQPVDALSNVFLIILIISFLFFSKKFWLMKGISN